MRPGRTPQVGVKEAPGNVEQMSYLAVRDRQPELMDDPDLDAASHHQALAGLRRVHAISGTAGTLWKSIRRLASEDSSSPLRVLDVACGGGDLTVALAKRAQRAGLRIQFSGCDVSQTALDYACAAAEARQTEVDFFHANVLADPLPKDFDVVCCSLFLHHLDEEDGVRLLKAMKRAAGRAVLISDLNRSVAGYVLTWCGLRLLTRSKICHVDGPLSVRAAFTPDEAKSLARRAELAGVVVTRHWPQRYLLTWNRT